MKKCLGVLVFLLLFTITKVKAQDPITLIIKEAVTRVIKAADLQIQRLQNETIWLQNAQKTVENTMAKLKLEEITDWVEKQRVLYAEYFEELRTVKGVLLYYHKVRDITESAKAIARDYATILRAVRSDPYLKPAETEFMSQVLDGLLEQSIPLVDALSLVIESFTTEMSDGSRMKLIDSIAEKIQAQHSDLKKLANQSKQLSLARVKEAKEIALVEALYGL